MKLNVPTFGLALSLLLAASVRADRPDHRGHHSSPKPFLDGAVYTMDNDASGNHVWAYGRAADGSLSGPWVYPTHGKGTGDGLGNQGAVALGRHGRWLFVCNAGSDNISVFAVTPTGLVLTDKAHSHGHRPISLALHGNLLYVLNAGGAVGGKDNVSGFLFAFGHLFQLPHSSRSLTADDTQPAQAAFTRDGDTLVVTEKATAMIDTFTVGSDGLIDDAKAFVSPNPPPFGFAAGAGDYIYVTEANGGGANPNGGSVSSYKVSDNGDLGVISASVPTSQTAACWLVLTPDERFAYSANTPSDSISSFNVHLDGSIDLLVSQAGLTGAGTGPVDMSMSHDGQFLYSLNAGNGTIGAFEVDAGTGALTLQTGASSLPATINGLAAW